MPANNQPKTDGLIGHNQVITITDIARLYFRGSRVEALKALNHAAAPMAIAPEMYRYAAVLAYMRKLGKASEGVHLRNSWQKDGSQFSLLVENCPRDQKISLATAAALFFGGDECKAMSHIMQRGDLHQHDSAGLRRLSDFPTFLNQE